MSRELDKEIPDFSDQTKEDEYLRKRTREVKEEIPLVFEEACKLVEELKEYKKKKARLEELQTLTKRKIGHIVSYHDGKVLLKRFSGFDADAFIDDKKSEGTIEVRQTSNQVNVIFHSYSLNAGCKVEFENRNGIVHVYFFMKNGDCKRFAIIGDGKIEYEGLTGRPLSEKTVKKYQDIFDPIWELAKYHLLSHPIIKVFGTDYVEELFEHQCV